MKRLTFILGTSLILFSLFTPKSHAVFIKINEQGEFCKFPGITVISNTGEKNSEFFNSLYKDLQAIPGLTGYYSLLPPESYHMTTINIATQDEFKRDDLWNTFVGRHLLHFQKLYDQLQKTAFQPTATFVGVSVFSIISLDFVLPKMDDLLIRQVAKPYGIEPGVPGKYHITLAYAFKPMPDRLFAQIEQAVLRLINQKFAELNHPLVLEAPQLHYFQDMTRFIPWNGANNPFLIPVQERSKD